MTSTVPVEAGLFDYDAAGAPHLLGSHCSMCERYAFPRTTDCPYCTSTTTEPVELSDNGTLWAWTAVTAAPPGYEGSVPFGFGIVELVPERLRVITRLEVADPAALTFAMPMQLVIVPLTENDDGATVVTWSFAAAPGSKDLA
jgi:uncharacterized OB-fold protein